MIHQKYLLLCPFLFLYHPPHILLLFRILLLLNELPVLY
jgi:hypothetical protein